MSRANNDEKIKEKNKEKKLKYEYRTNFNVLVGVMKDNFILLLLEKNKMKRNKMYAELMKQISRSTVPIRPDRHNPRKEKISRGKFKTNYKRSL